MYATHTEVELDLVVVSKDVASEGVVSLSLRMADGSLLPAWAPGAHTDLLMPEGLVRQYSICGDPGDRSTWELAILREPNSRGGSEFVHDRLLPGDRVRARGPRNHFPLLLTAETYVFIAGGIGITPMLPMVAAAELSGKPWTLHYGGRTRGGMAFSSFLEERYGDRVRLSPEDESGMLDLQGILGNPAENTLIYCCGPEGLLTAVESFGRAWPAGSLHFERFAPKKMAEPALTESFEVELALSDMVLAVPPEKSILEVVKEAGVQVLSSCTAGTCGTCETNVLDGIPEHRDSILAEEERVDSPSMFICVSRSCTPRLVLEL